MGTKQRDLKKSFNLAIRPLHIPCSFEEFCEALPNFTAAEHQRLHMLFTQVMTSLHGNVEVGAVLDTVEQLVEEQSLDPFFSDNKLTR